MLQDGAMALGCLGCCPAPGLSGASLPTTSLQKDFHKPGTLVSGFFFLPPGTLVSGFFLSAAP
jgi:hypothetical protein